MRKKRGKRGAAVIAAAVLAAVLLVADSRYHLQTTEYEVSFAALPEEFDGFRIVHLSDLHGMSFGRDNSCLAEKVKELEPDLIAMTGDFAAYSRDLSAAGSLLRSLEGTAPMYWVNGNHEWNKGGTEAAMQELVKKYGGTCLNDKFEPLYRGTGRIIIAGSDDPNTWHRHKTPEELAEELREIYPEDFVLWLGHRNFWVKDHPELPVELVLSGHAHGGIIRLPGIGGLLNIDHSFGATYEDGLYRGESFVMEVSRGLGNSIPVPRLFNRPEIAVIVLRRP